MKLGHGFCSLLVCCGALWIICSSSRVKALPPPGCDSRLVFSSEVSSSSEGNGDIHSRSLSPWSWRSSTEKNRIPSTIWEAKCKSSICSSPNHGQTDGRNLNSIPVYQNILVLYRQDARHCYTASYQSVAVGCTCIWAKINQNGTRT